MFLKDFVGNQRLVSLLRQGELPPASLFTGPDGIGKKTLALLLAAHVDCKAGDPADLCGRCTSCVKATHGNHPDIRLYRPEKISIKIESIRELNREAQFKPFEGRRRFFVLDEAEKLTEEAANAILKTLEEPPETTRIILVTAYPQRLLPTILSRCQTFVFRALRQQELARYLQEKTDLSNPDLRGRLSGGSLGKALTLDLEATIQSRDLMLELLEQWLENCSFDYIYRKCEENPLKKVLRSREGTREHLNLLELLGLDFYYVLTGSDERMVNLDQKQKLVELSRGLTLAWIFGFLDEVHRAQRDIDQNVQLPLCFETFWLKCRNQGDMTTP